MKTYREVEDLTPVTKESILNDMFGKYPKLLDYLRAKKFCDWPASKAHHGAEWGGLIQTLPPGYIRIAETHIKSQSPVGEAGFSGYSRNAA